MGQSLSALVRGEGGGPFQLDWYDRGISWVGLSEMDKILSQRRDQEGEGGRGTSSAGGASGVVKPTGLEGAKDLCRNYWKISLEGKTGSG